MNFELDRFPAVAVSTNITTKWLDVFSGKADEALGLLKDTLLRHLPTKVAVKLSDVFTDAPLVRIMKATDGSPKAILHHIDDLSSSQVTSLRKTTGASWDEVWTLVKKDVDLATAKRFDRKGIASVDDMAFYADKGVRPRVVKRLRKGVKGYGLTVRQTRALVKYASGAGYVLSKYGKVTTYCHW